MSLQLGKFAIHRAVFVGNELEVSIDSSTIRTGQSFVAVNPETGATLANFDEVKLKVTAVGTDGFDYKSSTITFLVDEEPGAEVPGEGSGEDNEQSGDGDGSSSEAGGVSALVIGGVVFLVMLMVIASILGAMLLRGNKEPQPTVDWGTETALRPLHLQPLPLQHPWPMHRLWQPHRLQQLQRFNPSQITHLIPGGQYVTGHAGETVYLSPDGTAWTMQADSSFIRTS